MLRQYGVLAYDTDAAGEPRFLLITSRETKRWVIPRGNRIPGLSPWQSAAQEAFEEAGLTGIVSPEEAGVYEYGKRRRGGPDIPALVHVFPLRTTLQSEMWPERHERDTGWFTRAEAASRVDEPGLKVLILTFKPPPEPAGRAGRALISPLPPPPPSRFPMLKLFKGLMPKENAFFDMFARHADTLVGGADAMSAMFAGELDVEEACRRIGHYEHQADDIIRDVLTAVRRSFITPFDRSAITSLVSAMDDAIDEMRQTAKAITLYDVTTFEPQMREISLLSAQAARLVVEAIPLLKSVGRNGPLLDRITENIVHLEGEADDLYDGGLKALFKAHGEDKPMDFFIGREIYRHLERVLDGFEDVADEIQGIVIDHA